MTEPSIEIGAKSELEELIKHGSLDGRTVFFMGNIINLYPLMSMAERLGINVGGIVDNNPTKAGNQIYKDYCYRVITAGEFLTITKNNVALIIFSERFWCQMREQMILAGLTEGLELFVLEGVTESKKRKYIEKAARILESFRKKYDEAFVYVFYGPLGDNYLFAGFVEEYNKSHNIGRFVCVGTGITKKICSLYGFKNIEVIDRESIVALEYLYMFLGNDCKDMLILPIWDWAFHYNRDCIRLRPEFNFLDSYRYYTFNTKDDFSFLGIKHSSKKNTIEAEEWFVQGRTIVLSPFAYSIQICPPEDFWEHLAFRLIDQGFVVAVNIAPNESRGAEKCFIEGAHPISFELQDGWSVLESAGTLICMRSGFCDIFWNAPCKKIILYPETNGIDYERHRSDLKFGSIAAMYGAEDAIELEFQDSSDTHYWEGFAERILEEVLTNARIP